VLNNILDSGLESLFGRQELDPQGVATGKRLGGLDESEQLLRDYANIEL
jgi:hypothetical protein